MSIELLVSLVVYIIIGGLVCWLLWWLIAYLGLPEPFAKVGRIVVAIIAVFFLIYVLLSLTGAAPMKFR